MININEYLKEKVKALHVERLYGANKDEQEVNARICAFSSAIFILKKANERGEKDILSLFETELFWELERRISKKSKELDIRIETWKEIVEKAKE